MVNTRTSDAVIALRRRAIDAIPGRLRLPARVLAMRLLGRLEREMAYLPALAPPGTVAVDVGANRGLYTYALARHCRVVHAIEPQPWCADTIRAWGNPRVIVHEVAASDRTGILRLSIPLRGQTRMTGYATAGAIEGPTEKIEVPAQPLDDLDLGPVDFIKIDVEGHEMSVLNGAGATIDRHRPDLLIEIEQRHLVQPATVTGAIEHITGLGYEGFFLDDSRWRSTDHFDPAVDQRPENAEKSGARYVNLFAFQPLGKVTIPR